MSTKVATTQWSQVLAARDGSDTEARAALESLCQTYWQPLYAYIRHQGYEPEEARDLTQGFFTEFLEKDFLADVDPSKGRFRSFLLASLRHYLSHERDRERALKRGAIWNEVKDRLNAPGTGLSGGQQQRLCIARAVATEPEVLLMDEPCSALDPIATAQVEELIDELRQNYSVVIVTHSMQQAARVSQKTAFFHLGSLVEFGETDKIFTSPEDPRTESYITGRIG